MKDEENTGWADEVATVTVEAVSKRGKQLIKRLGNRWWLCRMDNVACFDGECGVLIAPVGSAWHSPESRWVRATNWLEWQDKDLSLSEYDRTSNDAIRRMLGL